MKIGPFSIALFLVLLAALDVGGAIASAHGWAIAVELALALPIFTVGTVAAFRLAHNPIRLAEPTTALAASMLVAVGLIAGAWNEDPVGAFLALVEDLPTPLAEPPPVPDVTRSRTPIVPPGPDRLPWVPADIVRLIAPAQAMLQATSLDVEKCGGRFDGEKQCLCDYKLAVTDASEKITIVDAYEGKPSSPPGYVVNVSVQKGFERACGTNPILDVTHPPGQIVLAVRTVVKTDKKNIEPAVFTPFTDELNLPELRQAGLDYWWKTVKDGQKDMAVRQVPSQFFKERLVSDVVPAEHVFLLGLIENIGNTAAFAPGGSEAKQLHELDAVLVYYGIHREHTFDWRVSSANGRGPLQATAIYNTIRTYYPTADLPEDFVTGATNHASAVRFAFAHTDEEWRPLFKRSDADHRHFLEENPWPMQLLMAAGYNGFINRADHAVHTCKDTWRTAACGILRPETIPYLEMYGAIDPILFDPTVRARYAEDLGLPTNLPSTPDDTEDDTDAPTE